MSISGKVHSQWKEGCNTFIPMNFRFAHAVYPVGKFIFRELPKSNFHWIYTDMRSEIYCGKSLQPFFRLLCISGRTDNSPKLQHESSRTNSISGFYTAN